MLREEGKSEINVQFFEENTQKRKIYRFTDLKERPSARLFG